MLISKQIEIDFAHRLINHEGLCKNLHGHRYKFVVTVEGKPKQNKGASDEGMVVDFKKLKEVMDTVIKDPLDHCCIVTESDKYFPFFVDLHTQGMKIVFVPYVSTAENMALDLGLKLKYRLAKEGITLYALEVHETPTSVAAVLATELPDVKE